MASIQVLCRHCDSALIYKHGKAPTGLQRFRCRDCHRSFQYEYRYEGIVIAHLKNSTQRV